MGKKIEFKKLILVVEDVESNFLLIKTVLDKKYRLVHAWNGREAIEFFERYNPDLILMDLKLPLLSGIEATRSIRGIDNKVPIIALTAFIFDEDRTKAFSAGCNEYITKPISINELLTKIQYLIDR